MKKVIFLVLVTCLFLTACPNINIEIPGIGGGNTQDGGAYGPTPVLLPTIRSVPQPAFQHRIVNGVLVEPARIVPTCYYTDGRSNFFLINAGVINNAHISTILYEHYIGIETTLERSTVNKTSITRSATQTIYNSVTVTRFNSTTHTAETSLTVCAGKQLGPSWARKTFNATIGASWSGEWTTSHTNAETNAKSLTTYVSELQQTATRYMERFTLRNMPHGHYRRAMYSTVRIWVIVETTLDNSEVLGMTTVVVPEGTPRVRWSFCENGIFDNSPLSDGGIDFHYGFQNDLPIPATTVTLSTSLNPATAGTVNPPSQSNIAAGTPVSISAIANDGYRFVSWTVVNGRAAFANANTASTTVTLNSNAEIRANFELSSHELRVYSYPRNWGTVNRGSGLYSAHTPIPIAATPGSGNRFVSWTVVNGSATFANPNSASTTVTLSDNATIRANFLPTGAVFGGEVGRLALRNSAAFALRLRVQWIDNYGRQQEYRFGDTLNPNTRNIDPGNHGIHDGSWVRVHSFVVLGQSKTSPRYFLYRRGNLYTAFYRHTGTTLNNTLHFDGRRR